MAFMNQEKKKALAPQIKAVLKKFGMKGTIGVDNYSTIVVNLSEGKLDLIGEANSFNKAYSERTGQRFYEVKDHYQANPYKGEDAYSDATVGKFFKELTQAMRGSEWYDNTDIMTDYFDTAHYLSINVGKWKKPYKCLG